MLEVVDVIQTDGNDGCAIQDTFINYGEFINIEVTMPQCDFDVSNSVIA